MTQQIECLTNTPNALNLGVESLAFADIPGQSRLFLEYLKEPLSLRRYFPSAVGSHTHVGERVNEVLAAYQTERSELCDTLDGMNRRFGAANAVFENIEMLRNRETVAVVTGQQAGLFAGPLYTIYKALTAIRMTECLRARGVSAVPVFWAATEDHDFEEVASTSVLGSDGGLQTFSFQPGAAKAGVSVGSLQLETSIGAVIDDFFDAMRASEYSSIAKELVSSAYEDGRSFGEAFCRMIAGLLGKYGLIIVDPLDPKIKNLASPIYSAAVEKARMITAALVSRSGELVDDGYHAQVLVPDDHFPLFWHGDDGVRLSMKIASNGRVKVSGSTQTFSMVELADIATTHPERLSPGVMLRPVVQDYLLPTLCYFGGAAEIAYFAQNSEVFRLLNRPITTILHRQSFTIVEAKHARTLEKYDLEFKDLFLGREGLVAGIIDEHIDPKTARLFPDAEEKINTELNRLDQHLSDLDPTLARNLATRRRKILYHIAALRNKFRSARLRKDEEAQRQIDSLFASLMPAGGLQERSLNVVTFVNRYGIGFLDWMYGSVDLDDRGHRIIYL